jgi:hypothetical protein
MRFSASETAPVPWKNGGGATRELALSKDAQGLRWRLSLADIAQDGPFSPFPGLSRVHTILAGQGLTLSNADTALQARPFQPVHFDGGLALSAELKNGPCRAANLIFDPARVAVDISLHPAGAFTAAAGEKVFFLLKGSLGCGGQDRLDTHEGMADEAPFSGRIAPDGLLLQFRISPL